MSDLILKMSLKDELSKGIKEALLNIENLSKKALKVGNDLQNFKVDKKGILAGAIKTDIAEIGKLQQKLERLQWSYDNASSPSSRRPIKTEITTTKALLYSAVGREENRLSNEQKALRAEITKASKAMTSQQNELIKLELAQKRAGASTNKLSRETRELTKETAIQQSVFGKSSNAIVRHIRRLESLLVATYAIKHGYDVTLGAGHEFNKLIERETIGLKLLISQNLAYVDSQGKTITGIERYALAQNEANKAIKIARDINLKTPHSFGETLQIFKLLTPQVLKLGGSLEQTGEITQRMSVIAASMGIEFQQFLKTVDSALSGEMKESGLKRALEQFGVTNEGIKEIKARHGDVVKYVIDGLEQAKLAGADIFSSWAGATAQFKNEWDDLFGKIQKPMFDAMKVEIRELSEFMSKNKEEIVDTITLLGKTSLVAIKVAGAYYGLRVAISLYGKATKVATGAVYSHNAASTIQGRLAVANTSKIRALGLSLKSLALSNPILIALTAAFTAWEYVTNRQEEALDKLNKTTSTTIIEFARLDKASKAVTSATINTQIDESRAKLEQFRQAMDDINKKGGVGVSDVFFRYISSTQGVMEALTSSSKEELEILKEKIKKEELHNATLVRKKIQLQGITLEQQEAVDTQTIATEKANMLSVKWAEMNDHLAHLTETHKDISEELGKQVSLLYDQYVEAGRTKDEADKLVNSLFGIADPLYKGADGARALNAEMGKAVNTAVKLASVMIQAQVARGQLTKIEGLKANSEIKVSSIKDKISKAVTKEEKARLENELRIENINLSLKVEKIQNDMARKKAEAITSQINKTRELKIENAKAHKDFLAAHKLEIQKIREKGVLTKDDLIKIDTLKTQFSEAEKARNSKGGGGAGTSLAKQNKQLDRALKYGIDINKLKSEQLLLQSKINAGGTKYLSKRALYLHQEQALTSELNEQNKLIIEAQRSLSKAGTKAGKARINKEIEGLKKGELEIELKLVNLKDSLSPLEKALRDIFD
ncbi:MAG TPA: hypothetical protein EYG70_05465, partial [Sulfurimonas sp.]|nr:hypothetical protein [Sulfurimonas sp.]